MTLGAVKGKVTVNTFTLFQFDFVFLVLWYKARNEGAGRAAAAESNPKRNRTATVGRVSLFFFRVLLIITAQGEGGDSNAFACPETRLILVRSEADLLAGRRRFDGSATVTEGL